MATSRGNLQCLNCGIWEKSGWLYDESEDGPLKGVGGCLCNVCYNPKHPECNDLKDIKGLYKEIAKKNAQIADLWEEIDQKKN